MRSALLLLVCAASGFAQDGAQITGLRPEARSALQAIPSLQPQAVTQGGVEAFIPELILGGEWTSVIKLNNRGSQFIPTTNVYFVDNLGNPMKTTFQTSAGNVTTDFGFSFSLGAGNMIEVTFQGGKDAQFGHAIIDLCHSSPCLTGLYGEVTLRNRNPTRPDFESVFPLEQPATLQYMLFDHRAGVQTVLYLCNEDTVATNVSLEFTNVAGQTVTTLPVRMTALSSQILNLNALATLTNGLQGTLTIRSSGGSFITATALRINPSNSFTPVRTFIPHL